MSTDATSGDPDAHDVVDRFLTDMEAYGKSSRTLAEYRRVLEGFAAEIDAEPATAERGDCMEYVASLRRRDLSPSSIATYATYVHRFYGYLVKAEEFERTTNPMALVMEEMEEGIDKNPRRRELDVGDIVRFLESVNHPRDRCMLLVLFKTGIRAGELANLTLDDVSLDPELDDRYGTGGNALLNARSLYVASDVPGNKRERDTLIPLDDEVVREIERWLRVRPDGDSDALFVSLSPASSGGLSPESVARIMRKYTREHGWWSPDDDLRRNVTPHYCRHFFTTYLRDASGDDALVKYLRGDVGGDAIETYTHQWGDTVRENYEEYIYELLT